MGNGITERQNEEKSIAMLAAQRQLYSEAKKYNWIASVSSVWIPLVLALVSYTNVKFVMISRILSIISCVFSIWADKHINKKKKLAAYIQQKFDIYVYKMPWDSRLFGDDRNINREVIEYSGSILKNATQKDKLKNWYTPIIEVSNREEGILSCQRENFSWDIGVRERFRNASKTCILILCIVIIAIGVFKNEKVIDLIESVVFVGPMLIWLYKIVTRLNDDIERLEKLGEKINSAGIKTMDDLQDIQKGIFDHRGQCYIIPDFFYRIFRDNDEDREYKITHMNQ